MFLNLIYVKISQRQHFFNFQKFTTFSTLSYGQSTLFITTCFHYMMLQDPLPVISVELLSPNIFLFFAIIEQYFSCKNSQWSIVLGYCLQLIVLLLHQTLEFLHRGNFSKSSCEGINPLEIYIFYWICDIFTKWSPVRGLTCKSFSTVDLTFSFSVSL